MAFASTIRFALTLTTLTSLPLPALCDTPADSVGKNFSLSEVVVKAVGPRRVLRPDALTGAMQLDGSMLGELPTAFATPDPIAFVRTLPAVATTNDLQAAVAVRGSGPGDNYFTADGARVVNPMHMLGLFSAYNPAFFRSYSFTPGRISAVRPSAAAGVFEAESLAEPDSVLSGSVTAGLIESHGALAIPLRRGRTALAIGARRTYLDLLFPHLLTLGSSSLDYGFTDLNLSVISKLADDNRLRATVYANRDRMNAVNRKNGAKDGRFGWSNLAAAVTWQRGKVDSRLSFTRYENSFELSEGGRLLDLPSSLTAVSAMASMPLGHHWQIETDVTLRHSSGQHNRALTTAAGRSRRAFEWSAGASYTLRHRSMILEAGLRAALYNCNGYTTIVPMPRVNVAWELPHGITPFAAYTRTASFERLIQESTGGLPADFTTCADGTVKPLDTHSFEAGVSGTIPGVRVSCMLEGYCKLMDNCGEFAGSLIDLTNGSYNPLSDYHTGHGYAAGLSVTLMRQFGRVRGRVSYNLGTSRVHIPAISAEWFATSYDRLHDLTASVTWEPLRGLTVSASFTHATGLPYTRAKYGYIVGDNLICEYFAHNSSRLPAYNRLDAGAAYTLQHGRLTHTFRASVYNALGSENVLFVYTSYSIADGISQRRSVMKTVIPTLSYTIQF